LWGRAAATLRGYPTKHHLPLPAWGRDQTPTGTTVGLDAPSRPPWPLPALGPGQRAARRCWRPAGRTTLITRYGAGRWAPRSASNPHPYAPVHLAFFSSKARSPSDERSGVAHTRKNPQQAKKFTATLRWAPSRLTAQGGRTRSASQGRSRGTKGGGWGGGGGGGWGVGGWGVGWWGG